MNDQDVQSEKDPDQIEQEIDGTRSAITQKLEALEEKVRDTVQNAKETVEETIHSAKETVEETITTVKSSVEETVETVKRTFDLDYQVRVHPWPMLGASVLTGLAVGSLLGGRSRPTGYRQPRTHSRDGGTSRYSSPSPNYQTEERPPSAPASSFASEILGKFDSEIQQIKGMAIGFLMSGIRDLVEQSVPQLKTEIHNVMDSITTKLGGTPVREAEAQGNGANWR